MDLGVIFGASRGNIQMIQFPDIFLTEKVVFKLTSGSYSLQMGKSFRRDVIYIFLPLTHFGIKLDDISLLQFQKKSHDGRILHICRCNFKKVTRQVLNL